MIEIEQKFILSDGDKDRLARDAQLVNKRAFVDIYYDTADYLLTAKDFWLRDRAGSFELKMPIKIDLNRLTNQYHEVEDEAEIRKILGVEKGENFTSDLEKNGYHPFCRCTTTRTKYKKGDFIIDMDEVDYGDFKYNIGEIELLVSNKNEMKLASEKILSFAQENGLAILPVRGKVIEYLKQKKPEHYQTLVRVGVVKDF
jgi:adenylate cyclase class IV